MRSLFIFLSCSSKFLDAITAPLKTMQTTGSTITITISLLRFWLLYLRVGTSQAVPFESLPGR